MHRLLILSFAALAACSSEASSPAPPPISPPAVTGKVAIPMAGRWRVAEVRFVGGSDTASLLAAGDVAAIRGRQVVWIETSTGRHGVSRDEIAQRFGSEVVGYWNEADGRTIALGYRLANGLTHAYAAGTVSRTEVEGLTYSRRRVEREWRDATHEFRAAWIGALED